MDHASQKASVSVFKDREDESKDRGSLAERWKSPATAICIEFRFVAFLTPDGRVSVWDTNGKYVGGPILPSASPVDEIAFPKVGRDAGIVVVTRCGCLLSFYDPSSGELVAEFEHDEYSIPNLMHYRDANDDDRDNPIKIIGLSMSEGALPFTYDTGSETLERDIDPQMMERELGTSYDTIRGVLTF